jgi:cholera toxin transcriptional activator
MNLVRFGVFELDISAGELRKHGYRIRLQEQPLRLLICLVENSGSVVSREALTRTIWPEGTFVDYENGLNTAVLASGKYCGTLPRTPDTSKQLPGEGIVLSHPSRRSLTPSRRVSRRSRPLPNNRTPSLLSGQSRHRG